MDVPQPGTDRLVGIGIGRLSNLNEIGGIKNGLKVGIVAALQQIDTANNAITVDVFLVLMEQKYPCRARSCNHFSQPSQYLVAVLGWIDGTAVTSIPLVGRRRIEGKDANIGCLQSLRHCYGPLKKVQVLV